MPPRQRTPVQQLHFLDSERGFLHEQLQHLRTARMLLTTQDDRILARLQIIEGRINLLKEIERNAEKKP